MSADHIFSFILFRVKIFNHAISLLTIYHLNTDTYAAITGL